MDLVIPARRRSLGGFEVGRILPFMKRRMIGPFVFLDHMGPLTFPPDIPRSTDVRPHPHIGLSTVTYLFDGEMTHRDSLGFEQAIRPGEINWMIAGRGISHSERFDGMRRAGGPIDGIHRPGWHCPRPTRKQRPISATTRPATCPDRGEGPQRPADRRIGLRCAEPGQSDLAAVLP